MQIIRSWRELKILLKRKFPELEDEDLEYKADQRESMLSKLSTKLKKTTEELEQLFAELQTH